MRKFRRLKYRVTIFVLILLFAYCIINFRNREPLDQLDPIETWTMAAETNTKYQHQSNDLKEYINLKYGKKKWIHPRCNCSRGYISQQFDPDIISTCPLASFRGPHQNVISYSFYGQTSSGYFKGVVTNTESIAQLYPGWTVRVYHDISPKSTGGMSDLCQVVCKYTQLDECYVGDITDQFPGIDKKFGMLWRFVVLGDPTVDMFGVRDLDSPVYQREVDAVRDWLTTNKTWHIMRDNPAHTTYILGGMWGARNTNDIKQMQRIRDELIDKASSHIKSSDQVLLSRFVWPVARQDMVAHDSFLCQHFNNTKPWPSPRVNRTFVGDMYGLSITKTCPAQCRPIDHQDWLYC